MELQTFPVPSEELFARGSICFIHPGYGLSPYRNKLLELPRADQVADKFGVHHDTALVACQIIANNAFETGYLAPDKQGKQRVSIAVDDILTEKYYYFVIPGPESKSQWILMCTYLMYDDQYR